MKLSGNRRLTSPLGVCVLAEAAENRARTVVAPHYLHEILGHAGLCYQALDIEDLEDALPGLGLLLTIGETALPGTLPQALAEWVRGGGGWISIAGLCELPGLLGADYLPPIFTGFGGGRFSSLGEGYLEAKDSAHPVTDGLPMPLHFFGGIAVQASGANVLASGLDSHQRPVDRPLVLENAVGGGRSLLIAPDVTGTVVRIQQGVSITRDGVPAPDGTAPIDDGVLKTDDGMALDWHFDRTPLPDTPSLKAFLEPVADYWREIVLKSVFYLAQRQGVTLPLLWLYPDNLTALGHISHDTDGNDPRLAHLLLDTLDQAKIRSTWCVILPGYAPDVIDAIRDAGHELATHYDAMSEGLAWGEPQFDRQWRHLCEMFAPDAPVTNKNHYLRWQGDTEFFEWCIQRGIRMDQSKGPSKSGGAGFIFGTCHPHFPVTPRGETLDILELPTHTQDLIVFAPEGLADSLIAAAERHHGVAHLLFHPSHIAKPGVAEAIINSVRKGAERGLAWWTARQINDWERARRKTTWTGYNADVGGVQVCMTVGEHLPAATLLFLAPAPVTLRVMGRPQGTATVRRWGVDFQAAIIDLEAGAECRFEVSSS